MIHCRDVAELNGNAAKGKVHEGKMNEEKMHEENSGNSAKDTDYSEPTVEVYEAPVTNPLTGERILAQFHVEAKDGGIAAGIVYGGINIGDRRKKNDE